MDINKQIESAEKNLERILSFFERVESRSSVIFAINTAMLAFLAANCPSLKTFTEWYMYIVILPLILIAISFWNLYKCNFPKLKGGPSSLLYFREICRRTKSNYISEFKNLSDTNYLQDLLTQAWRNSEILSEKFSHLKYAYQSLALAIAPWVISLSIFIWKNGYAFHL